MSTLLDADTSVLLDFDPVFPCQIVGQPDHPATWMSVWEVDCEHNNLSLTFCDDHLAYMRRAEEARETSCGVCQRAGIRVLARLLRVVPLKESS